MSTTRNAEDVQKTLTSLYEAYYTPLYLLPLTKNCISMCHNLSTQGKDQQWMV